MLTKTHILNGLLGVLTPSVLVLWSIVRLVSLHSEKFYNTLNEWLFATFMRVYLFYFEYLGLNKVFVYGDVDILERSPEKVLYIANHLSTSDWFLVSMLLARQGNIGRSRFLLHKNLKYIPVFGFYLSQASFIFVDRANFQAEKAKNVLRKQRAVESKVWLVIYPEGTRYNPEHKDATERSQQFAVKNNISPYRHVLTPRTRGFQLLMDNMHDYLDALYDATVIYADEDGRPLDCRTRAPQMTRWFNQRHTLHIHLNRIPMNQLPKQPEQLKSWLMERFRIKDEFLERVQSKFYEPSEPIAVADSANKKSQIEPQQNSPSVVPNHVQKNLNNGKCAANIPITETISQLLSPQLPRRFIQLTPLTLMQLLPSMIFFYGVTFYWLLGFGWYGPLTFILVSIFGTLAGEVYVHYAV